MADSKSVIPLESNPTIFTDLAHKLGVSPILQFHDVYSLTDHELLSFLPQPIYAIILLFPLTKNYETYKTQQDSQKQPYSNENKDKIKWFKQTIANGCGLYALLHILSNLPHDLIIKNSKISNIINQISNQDLTIDDESKIIENLENSIKLDENFGEKGTTEIPEEVNLHFITFIKSKDNHLYELDGRRNGPIDLGECTKDSIIYEDSVTKKIQFYIDHADEENKHNFALMAIGPTLD
ncbi:unnamed protein product [Candida verbasci]|uniref:Ubiquitin carboxyl-terminal hydrolase n=1 Tax=Candida verbasci TaxID=1227364 RepID=A0A9W4XG61_9ASCO|nr:unnamed protein product [Candida verbasci]